MRCWSALFWKLYKLNSSRCSISCFLIEPAAMKWILVERHPKRLEADIFCSSDAFCFQLMRMGATVTFSGRKGCVFYSCWSGTATETQQRCRLLRSKATRFRGRRLKNINKRGKVIILPSETNHCSIRALSPVSRRSSVFLHVTLRTNSRLWCCSRVTFTCATNRVKFWRRLTPPDKLPSSCPLEFG